jgi:hypothetical protein
MSLIRQRALVSAAALLATAVAPSSTTYYKGARSIATPSGQEASGLDVATAVTLTPADSSIVERLVSGPLGSGTGPTERVVTFRVSGTTFRAADRDGVLSGEGILRGRSWVWSGWDATIQLPNGGVIQLCDSLTADSLVSHQRLYGSGNQLLATIVDRLARTDSVNFLAARGRILGSPRPASTP